MPMEDDWDLNAVVRGGHHRSAAAGSSAADFTSQDTIFKTELPAKDLEAMDELHEIYKPFLMRNHRKSPPDHHHHLISSPQTASHDHHASLSLSLSSSPPSLPSLEDRLNDVLKQGRLFAVSNARSTNGSKKRRSQNKRICHLPADALTIDVWGWRKYGQKPIKGSPFPRGYYRCSNSKSCMARKQVERSRSDPTMFVITYTGEHNHLAPINKSSLSGTTRQIKKQSPDLPAAVSSEEDQQAAINEELDMDQVDIAADEDDRNRVAASDVGKCGHIFRLGLEGPAGPASDQNVCRSRSMLRTINLLL